MNFMIDLEKKKYVTNNTHCHLHENPKIDKNTQ